jgi:hypothetical protein
MSLHHIPAARLTGRSVMRLFTGLAAALVLLPVPAMALTFTGGWQSVTAVSGGPTPPTPTVTDVTNGADDNLTVDMGSYQGSTKKATSVIVLVRPVTISSASEAIRFAEQFSTDFSQGGVALTMTVSDSKGNLIATPISFGKSTTSTSFVNISDSESAQQTFKAGNYYLGVGVAYDTTNKIGGWKTKSKHHFEFTGL